MKNQNINIFNSTEFKPIPRKQIARCVSAILDEHKIDEYLINIIIQTNDEIRKINKEFLNHDYETDVISFNLEETPLEGEVYISIDKTIEQANDYEVSIKDELLRLISHGVLHLVGYNDTTENEKNSMHKLENKYIELSKKK